MKSTIQHVRGDTENIQIEFYRNGNPIVPNDVEAGDLITFTVREPFDGKILLQKQATYPSVSMKIEHADTKDLPLGAYAFDIEYSKPDKSVVKTLIVGEFRLLRDVTF